MFRILVVDDDKNTRYYIKEALEWERYKVFCASNGEEALEVYEREFIDLVIVDIMMPKMDGYELTRQLRATNKDLLVLMISAKQLPEDRKKGFKAGIDDYMSKPIDTEELLLHIKALLGRGKIASQRQIVVWRRGVGLRLVHSHRSRHNARVATKGIFAVVQIACNSQQNFHKNPTDGRNLGRRLRHGLGNRHRARGQASQTF